MRPGSSGSVWPGRSTRSPEAHQASVHTPHTRQVLSPQPPPGNCKVPQPIPTPKTGIPEPPPAPHTSPYLLRWASQRQGSIEGGFNGRTNKLVDGCYSFWQGGLFQVLQKLNQNQLLSTTATGPSTHGGAGDQMGKVRDLHTFLSLSTKKWNPLSLN